VSDTPISDSTPHNVADLGMLVRRLERKLNTAQDRIKRLEEAGDAILNANNDDEQYEAMKQWHKAKEAKP
jgi:hypothetical protein